MNFKEILNYIEDNITKLLIDNEINYIDTYRNIYDFSLDLQKQKTNSSRNLIIEYYNTILTKIKHQIELCLKDILIKITDDNLISNYIYEQNLFEKNLTIIDNLLSYYNQELLKLDKDFVKINYYNYGKTKWIDIITNNCLSVITNHIISFFDYRNINDNDYDNYNDNLKEIGDNINYILDNIYYCIEKKIINPNYLDDYFYKKIINSIEINIIKYENKINEFRFNDKLNAIYKYKCLIENNLNELNLNNIYDKSIELINHYLINTNKIIYNFDNILEKLDFNNFKETYEIDNYILKIIMIIIRLINDYDPLINIIDCYFTNLLSLNFEDNVKVYYFIASIREKLFNILSRCSLHETLTIGKLFSLKNINNLDNPKLINELLNNYIKKFIYKSNNSELKLFKGFIFDIFDIFKNSEEFFLYYKNYMIKRIYKNNFQYEIEIEILSKINKDKTELYKINKIINDLQHSDILTNQFNDIYNYNSKITTITNGLWNISPKLLEFSSSLFKHEINKLNASFDNFYNCKYEKRKLDWNYEVSSCILNYNIDDTNTIEIKCSLLQANTLFHFNEQLEFTDNSSTIKNLKKYKILKKKDNDTYLLNLNFKAKDNFINIRGINKKKQTNKLKKKCDKEEIFTMKELMEMYIVRTLKNKENISSDALSLLIKTKFNCDNKIIDFVLKDLIDKSYIYYENSIYYYIK